jgi:hypothetical protein
MEFPHSKGARQFPMEHWNVEAGLDSALYRFNGVSSGGKNGRSGLVLSLGPYLEEAKLLAAATGRTVGSVASCSELVDELSSTQAETVTVIGEVQSINYSCVAALLSLTSGSGSPFPHVGFITGFERESVRWSLLKSLLQPQRTLTNRPLFVFGCEPDVTTAIYSQADILWLSEIDQGPLETLLKSPRPATVLVSHSNGVDGNFGNVILCPIDLPSTNGESRLQNPRAKKMVERREGIPSCIHSELCQRDPRAAKRRVHPHLFRSDIVLYDTCAGVLFDSAFSSPEHSLGASFMTGCPAALITSARKKSSTPITAAIFTAMLFGGFSLGEIVSALNAFQELYYGELPSFVLLGDPTYRLHERGYSNIHHSRKAETTWEGTVAKLIGAPVRGIVVPRDPSVLCLTDRVTPTQRWLFRISSQTSQLRLRTLPPLKIRPTRPDLEAAAVFIEALIVGLNNIGVASPDLQLIATKCRELLPVIDIVAARAGCAAICADEFDVLERRVEEISSEVLLLNGRLPLAWRATNQWLVLHHYYSHFFFPSGPESLHSAACPICHSAVVQRFSACSATTSVRQLLTCIRCGVIADLPKQFSITQFNGPTFCRRGDQVEFTVSGQCVQPWIAADATAYFAGFGATVFEGTITDPVVTATGKNSWLARFTLVVSHECPPALYSLVVAGSIDLQLFTTAKYVTVVPCDTGDV